MNLGSGPSLKRRTKFVKLSVQLHQQGRNLALVWEIPFYLILQVELLCGCRVVTERIHRDSNVIPEKVKSYDNLKGR